MTGALLEIRGLRGGYGDVDVLTGIDLTVASGEILTVAGTNGAGKSTLAKAIVGLLPRVEGVILFEGREVRTTPAHARAALGIGYVPQVANVFGSMTVLENLQVVVGVEERRKRIDELFAIFPVLGQRRRTRAGSLSGGERQQLAFARALMPRPRLVVLDEPTAALAPAKVKEAFELIARLPALGVSTLIVEQRARQSLEISHRGCIMDGGKAALTGEARMLLADERAAELYLGRH